MLSRNRPNLDSTVMVLILILLVAAGAALAWGYLAGGIQGPQDSPAALPPAGGAPALPAGAAAPSSTAQRFVIVPDQSAVTYRANETLFNEGNRLNTAVGRTTAVRGEVLVDRARPANSRLGPITVDISRFTSDSARRDNAIRERWLESARYPEAIFTATEIKGLPDTYRDGQEIRVQLTGNLRVRSVTRPTSWTASIKLEGNTLTVTGSTTVKMTDFGFDPPSLFFLKAENEGRLEFRFVARS